LIGRTPLCFGFLSARSPATPFSRPETTDWDGRPAQLDNWIDGAIELLAAVGAGPGAAGAQSALRFCLRFRPSRR